MREPLKFLLCVNDAFAPHLAVRSCFGLSMVQLSTAPIPKIGVDLICIVRRCPHQMHRCGR